MRSHPETAEMLCLIQEAVEFLSPRVAEALLRVVLDNPEEVETRANDVLTVQQMDGAVGVLEWVLRQNTPAAKEFAENMQVIRERMGLD